MALSRLALSLFCGLSANAALAQTSSGNPRADCDRLAAAPLDPQARAPAVWFDDLFKGLDATIATCRAALDKERGDKPLQLQFARALAARGASEAVAHVRTAAAGGLPEAHYIVFKTYQRVVRNGAGPTQAGALISRAEAEAGLRAAANAGHPDAIRELGEHLARGYVLRLDRSEARKWLALAASDKGREKYREDTDLAWADMIALDPAATAEEKSRAFKILSDAAALDPYREVELAQALRRGVGVAADPARARKILEERGADSATALWATPPLADMLLNGEGGPADVPRALKLLTDDRLQFGAGVGFTLARAYVDGRAVGRNPRRALEALSTAGFDEREAALLAAQLLATYRVNLARPHTLRFVWEEQADAGDPAMLFAFATLKLTPHEQFRDQTGGWAMMRRAADAGNQTAVVRMLQIDSNLGIQAPPIAPDNIRAKLAPLMAQNVPAAIALHGKLLRAGVVFPQDDAAATASLKKAAELGDVEAMTLLAKAYDDGRGVAKNAGEQLRWLREAVKRDSVEARVAMLWAFRSADPGGMSLREGVTDAVGLFNDRVGNIGSNDIQLQLMSRAARGASVREQAAAVMEGYRLAPAGLDEDRVVPLMRQVGAEIRREIEAVLKTGGFYKGEADGIFGPEARAALAAWTQARPPASPARAAPQREAALGPMAAAPGSAADEIGSPGMTIPGDIYRRASAKAVETLRAWKTPDQKLAALRQVNVLARFGDPTARWTFVSAFTTDAVAPRVVSTSELVRYNLDLIIARQSGMERAGELWKTNVAALAKAKKSGELAASVLMALRDDPRLHAPETYDSIIDGLRAAPGLCAALAREAQKQQALSKTEADGCSPDAREALVAFAKQKGPTGVEMKARSEARTAIVKLAGP